MSGEALPEYLDLHRLAEQEAVLGGHVPLRAMKRLAASLASDQGDVEAELHVELDAQRRPMISGWARAEVELVCQRCLDAYRQPLAAEFRLAQVQSEAEAERLPDDVEPLLRGQGRVRTAELLEDELILALPVVATHGQDSGCRMHDIEQPAASEAGDQRKPSAFAALAALNRKKD